MKWFKKDEVKTKITELKPVVSLINKNIAIPATDPDGAESDEIIIGAGITRADLRKVTTDDEIGQALSTRLEAVIGTNWTLSGEGEAFYEFIEKQLKDHLENLIRGAWDAVPYGYSVQEIYWLPLDADNKYAPERIVLKPFEWFNVYGGTTYYAADTGDVDIDKKHPGKFLTTVRSPTELQENGTPLLSQLYWPWFFKTEGAELWAISLERFGAPILKGEMNTNEQAKLDAFAAQLVSAGRVGAIALPEGTTVETLIGAPGTIGAAPHKEFLEYYNQQVQKVVLGQNLTSQVQGGSHAAAQIHNLIRMDKRNADCRLLEPTVTLFIRFLMEYNYPGMELPVFKFDDGVGLQVERAERDSKLCVVMEKSGKKFSEAYFMDEYGIDQDHMEDAPMANTFEEFMALKNTGKDKTPLHINTRTMLNGKVMGNKERGELVRELFAEKDTGNEPIDKAADSAIERTPSPVRPQLLMEAIKRSSSPEELELELGKILEESGNIKHFKTLFEQSLFTADMIGYTEADDES